MDGARPPRGPRHPAWQATGVLAVLGLLAAICLGAWGVLGHRVPEAAARNVDPVGEDGRYAREVLALAPFGDNSESYVHVRTFDQVVGMKFLSEAEIATFRDGGASASRVVVASRLPEGKLVAVVVKMSNRQAAVDTADRLNGLHLAAGFQQRPDRPWLRRVETLPDRNAAEPARPVGRVLYVHGDLLARVELTGRPGVDLAAGLTSLVTQQLDVLPANG